MPDTKHRVRLYERHRKLNLCYIFGCDDTCSLDVVETFLSGLKEKFRIGILAFKNHFSLSHSSELCDSIIPDLQMDFAIFVVHANENRLSINEDIDRIGYKKIYRALMKATDDRVIVVITGDSNYMNSAEEQSFVLSRWAWGKMSPQFNVEFLDGRKSFIFSWDKEHRPIHEEAMMHFLDPEKKGKQFDPKPKDEPRVVVEDHKKTVKSQERGETDVKATKTKQNSSNIQPTKHRMESDSSNVDAPSPEEEVKEKILKCFRLFNCDKTYKFDAVKKLLEGIKKAELSFDISIQEHYFDLRNMSEVCDRINKKELQMDFAIFVVHAQESRLSINEDNAGIGYAKLYRALLQATDERVLIVIGGDDNYKDSAEEQSTVLSRWARRKVSSQFNEEFLDGRKSFIFSWDKEHRPIHEEAMLHFFDKKGETFVPKPKDEATVALEDLKTVESQERSTTDVKATKTEENSPANQTQKYEAQETQSRREHEEVSMHPLQTDEKEPLSLEYLYPDEEQGTEEPMDTSDEFVNVEHNDVPKECSWIQPDTGASSLPETIAILYRDKSDIDTVRDVFGDVLQGPVPFTSDNPTDLKDLLLTQSVRSCFIIVEARKLKEELQKKSHTTPYRDLLKTTTGCTVEKKVVVILCNKGSDISSSEENAITATIEKLLGEKGFILWLKGGKSCLQTNRKSLSRSQASPVYDGAAKKESPTHVASSINPEELVLHTRLRNGKISYEKSDVKVRLNGWKAPQEMTDNLFKNNQSIANAELLVYREIKTGNERTVVNEDVKSQLSDFKGALENVGKSVPGVARMLSIGSSIGLCGSGKTSPPNNDTPPAESETDTPSSNDDTDGMMPVD